MNLIFTDLSKLSVMRLLARARRLFACSIGIFFLLAIPFAALLLLPGENKAQKHLGNWLAPLAVMELLVWASFARAWNELKRRTLIEQHGSSTQ